MNCFPLHISILQPQQIFLLLLLLLLPVSFFHHLSVSIAIHQNKILILLMAMHLIVSPDIVWVDRAYHMKRFAALRKITVNAHSAVSILAKIAEFLELPRLYRPYHYTCCTTLKVFVYLRTIRIILRHALISDGLKMNFLDPVHTGHVNPSRCRSFSLVPQLN